MRNKTLILLLAIFAISTAAFAQQRVLKEANPLSLKISKRFHNKQPDLSRYPVTPASTTRSGEGSAATLNFPDRVWFPGEWEEVKAIVVSPRYEFLVVGHEDDERYRGEQEIKNYGLILYQESKEAPADTLGRGELKSLIDVTSPSGLVFLRIMDGIQEGGAEAWVRIEESADEQLVRDAMEKNGFRQDKMKFFIAPGNAYWFRDCGPICFYYGNEDKVAMLNFLYGASRPCDDLLPSYIHRYFGIPNYINDISWEGGNCLVDGVGGLITSSAVYSNNLYPYGRMRWIEGDTTSITVDKRLPIQSEAVRSALSGMLGQRQLTVLPRLNYDGQTGHIDLYIDAMDENSLLITKMPDIYADWSDYDIAYGNAATLYNKKTIFGRKYYDAGRLPMPSNNNDIPWATEMEYDKYARAYANHTFVNDHILQPCFSPVGSDGMPEADWDRKNIEDIQKLYPGYHIYCIDMRTFDGQGGSIHCVTKQIPADNPVRIIHKNIHGSVNPGTLTSIPFSAIITNKSGIKEARLIYSVEGGNWHEATLTANGNRWSCTIPVSSLTEGQTVGDDGVYICYYIQATSNNGKTVTKPFNAAKGTVYNFALTTKGSYDESMFDFATTPMPADQITFKLDTDWLTEDTSTAPTAVTEVKSQYVAPAADNIWYTINGLRLATHPTAKGIYIHNGKKIVIK